MTTADQRDTVWAAIYAAEFVRLSAIRAQLHGLEDGGILRDAEDARALADWELEMREEMEDE